VAILLLQCGNVGFVGISSTLDWGNNGEGALRRILSANLFSFLPKESADRGEATASTPVGAALGVRATASASTAMLK
jgi:hypothetical protein